MFLSKFTPAIYAFVKKHKRIRNTVKKVWDFYSRSKIKFIGIITMARIYDPPVGIIYDLTGKKKKGWNELSGGMSMHVLSEKSIIHRSLPGTMEEKIHWKFRQKQETVQPETFLLRIAGGRVYQEGAIISPDNRLIATVSKYINAGEYAGDAGQHPIFREKKLPPLRKIAGTVAVLSAPAGRGYYHWMLDVLPRIDLLQAGGYDLGKIDKFLINNYLSRFHHETLDLIGIPKSRIIESQDNPHLEADMLIVPSLVGDTGSVPKYACEFLRRQFLEKAPVKESNPRRLYLNRGQTLHRRVSNEAAVVALLAGYGFESITLEKLKLTEQISLMRTADIIVCPHGAGLTNIVFCRPGTTVIEFLHPGAVNTMYWTICNEINLSYYYLMTEGEHPPENVNPYSNNSDMLIDINKLTATLDLAGVARLT